MFTYTECSGCTHTHLDECRGCLHTPKRSVVGAYIFGRECNGFVVVHREKSVVGV